MNIVGNFEHAQAQPGPAPSMARGAKIDDSYTFPSIPASDNHDPSMLPGSKLPGHARAWEKLGQRSRNSQPSTRSPSHAISFYELDRLCGHSPAGLEASQNPVMKLLTPEDIALRGAEPDIGYGLLPRC